MKNYRQLCRWWKSPCPIPSPPPGTPAIRRPSCSLPTAEIITQMTVSTASGFACDSTPAGGYPWDTHIRPLVIGKGRSRGRPITRSSSTSPLYAYRPWVRGGSRVGCTGQIRQPSPSIRCWAACRDKVLAYASTGSLEVRGGACGGRRAVYCRGLQDDEAPCSPRRSLRGRPIIAEIKKRVGDKLKIAVDANQGLVLHRRRARGQVGSKEGPERAVLEEIGIEWIEGHCAATTSRV